MTIGAAAGNPMGHLVRLDAIRRILRARTQNAELSQRLEGRVPAANWLVLALVVRRSLVYTKDPFLRVPFSHCNMILRAQSATKSGLSACPVLGYYVTLCSEAHPSGGDERSEGSSDVRFRLSTCG